jgi:hypothetical protein
MNITQISELTQEELIKSAHSFTAVPALLILFITMSLILLIIGLILIDKSRSGYSKFLWIWATANLFNGAILIFLVYSPFAVQAIKNFFIKLFS